MEYPLHLCSNSSINSLRQKHKRENWKSDNKKLIKYEKRKKIVKLSLDMKRIVRK